MGDPGRKTAMSFFLLFSLLLGEQTNSFYHWCAEENNLITEEKCSSADKKADRTPKKASRINPGLKGMVSPKENPSCRQMSFQKLGKLRHHVTELIDSSLNKQHCQKSIPGPPGLNKSHSGHRRIKATHQTTPQVVAASTM